MVTKLLISFINPTNSTVVTSSGIVGYKVGWGGGGSKLKMI